jgi:hypothetical protein
VVAHELEGRDLDGQRGRQRREPRGEVGTMDEQQRFTLADDLVLDIDVVDVRCPHDASSRWA